MIGDRIVVDIVVDVDGVVVVVVVPGRKSREKKNCEHEFVKGIFSGCCFCFF